MRECPSCGVDGDDRAHICPICGYEFPQQKSWPRRIAFVLLLLIAYVIVRLVVNYF